LHKAELMSSVRLRTLSAMTGALFLTAVIAACTHDSPVAPAAAENGACAYIVFPTATRTATVGGTFLVSVRTNAASGQVTTDVTIAVDGAATARQGTVTVSWPGGIQSIDVTQSCDVTQTLNVPAEGQQFTVAAPASGCRLPVSSVLADVPWIAVRPPPAITHPPPVLPPDSFDGIVGVNTGPERIGHLTTPIGQITVVQRAGNCVTAIAPTSQAFDENGGAGSFSVTAVPGCAWDATSHSAGVPFPAQVTPATAHGTGSGAVPFTVAANSDTSPRAGSYLVGGSLMFQITQSACPVTVSPLSFHVPAAAADYFVAVRITGAVSCFWAAGSTAFNFIVIGNPGIMRGSGDVRLSVRQNQTGTTRTGSATVADQTVVVTQDP